MISCGRIALSSLHPSSSPRQTSRIRRSTIKQPPPAPKFWEGPASELHWFKKWDKVLDWKPPYAKWFAGGKTNISYNCLDVNIQKGLRNKAAIVWEGEPGEKRTLTYWDLYRQVCKFANVLKGLGVEKGDRVAIYLPMIPELAIAMLACVRIGAVHSVVFGGFSADSLADRINDAQAKILITADGGFRRGGLVPLKHDADYALRDTPCVKHVIIVRRGNFPIRLVSGRDLWWDDLMQAASPECEAEPLDSEDMSYILYTSGTTGKPKGIVHTTGGYMVGCYATSKWVFDLKPEDLYWCTADIGWVTGHSYVVYGPLANGASILMYEGAPDWPDRDRFWALVEEYGVTVMYTAPTAIRAFMKWGTEPVERHDLSSLRLLGTVGEPINPEAWMWYYQNIGKGQLPDRRYLVADRDGAHTHHHAAGDRHDASGICGEAPARDQRGDHWTTPAMRSKWEAVISRSRRRGRE